MKLSRFTTVYVFSVFSSTLFLSCGEETKPKDDFTTDNYIQTFGKRVKTDIGATGLTIDLPETHKIEEHKGPDFVVYYITSIDTTYNKGGAGIYVGPTPDTHGPPNLVSKEESTGTLLGKPSKGVKYITPTYTWFESVIDEAEGTKIQTWVFSYNEVERYNLALMMETLARKN